MVYVVALWSVSVFAASPRVYWASDPVGPGQAVMVIGNALGDHATVELARLADTAAAGRLSTHSPGPAKVRRSRPCRRQTIR